MNIGEAYKNLQQQLATIYDESEASGIAHLVFEHLTGYSKMERMLHKSDNLMQQQIEKLQEFTLQLLQCKPLQYVLNEAWFAGNKFYVNEDVLIPRPETEELVEWVAAQVKSEKLKVKSEEAESLKLKAKSQYTHDSQLTIHNSHLTSNVSRLTFLDIGTGSGCIAISLKRQLPEAEVFAVDISENALEVAQQNALQLKTPVHFSLVDILDENQWATLPFFDVIVSNPPYIMQQEETGMQQNVLSFEPHNALFVPNHQPLLFYNAIANFAVQKLKNNGLLFFEINEQFGKEMVELLISKGFTNIELKQDMQGKDRMVKAAFNK